MDAVCSKGHKKDILQYSGSTKFRISPRRQWDFISLYKRKGVEIIEAECCKDQIHMLVRIPPSISVSDFMGYLKGKSSLMIFDRHANLKYKYGNRKFWYRGYYVDTCGKNAKKIEEYIRNQLMDDQAGISPLQG